MADNVIQFPREIATACEVRECQRHVDRLTAEIEAADPDTQDGFLKAGMAERLLDYALYDLMRAKAEAAAILVYNGVTYAEMAGRA